jgi:hypothetical protein
MKWRILAISSTSILLVLLALLAALFRDRHGLRIFGDLDAPAVVTQVKQLSQLLTVKYSIQRVVGLRELKEPFGEESILLMVQGTALAGVDLSKLSERDLRFTDHAAVLELPPARLIDVYLDEKQTRVWDRHITWWTPWVPYSPDLEHRARLSAIEDVRSAALNMGILDEAQKNAQVTLVNFFKALGLSVTFGPRQT